MLSRVLAWSLGVSLMLVVFLVPLSIWVLSRVEHREGLEVIADKLNLTTFEFYRAPLHDYVTPGVENPYLTTVIAGIIGVAIIVISSSLALKLIRARRGGKGWQM